MNIGLILAGGSGTRMGSNLPKQFMEVHEKPLIIYTIEAFNNNPNIEYIAIICKADYKEKLDLWVKKFEMTKVKWVIDGGDTRQSSVECGLKILDNVCSEDDIIVIHDGARPLISQKIISDNIEAAIKYNATNTVIPSADTIIVSKDGQGIDEVPPRNELYLCQTPQSFKFGLIKKAHENAKVNNIKTVTDDCQLVLKLGEKVHLVNGDKFNFKVTTAEDFSILRALTTSQN